MVACRHLWNNNIGGELPVQYSALTSLQYWCVTPIRSGGSPERFAAVALLAADSSLRGWCL